VFAGMMLARFSRVVGRIVSMPVRDVSVMPSLFVIPAFVVLGRFTMVFRRMLVMFRRLIVVLRAFVYRHLCLSAFQ
jgi:hypothetical protein